VRNDLEWRDRWVARLRECEEWYADYMKAPPPCYLIYTTNIKQGQIDYQKRTVPLSITAGIVPVMQWYSTANRVVKTVLQGLLATGRTQTWGLHEWAIKTSISSSNPFQHYINSHTITFEIANAENKSIGQTNINFPCGSVFINQFNNSSDLNFSVSIGTTWTVVTFPSVDPYDITDRLTIRISGIDSQPTEQVAQRKNISILTEDEYNANPQSIPSGEIILLLKTAEPNFSGEDGIIWENSNRNGIKCTVFFITTDVGTNSLETKYRYVSSVLSWIHFLHNNTGGIKSGMYIFNGYNNRLSFTKR